MRIVFIVLYSLLTALFLSHLARTYNLESELSSEPYIRAETPSAILYNVFLTLAIVSITGFILFTLIKRAKINVLRAVKIVLISFLILVLTTLFTSLILMYLLERTPLLSILLLLPHEVSDALIIMLPIAASAVHIYMTFICRNELVNALAIATYGTEAGTYLAVILPQSTVIVVAIALALYDLFAVYRGFIGKLVDELRKGVDQGVKPHYPSSLHTVLHGFILKLGSIGLGVGDIVVYSMIVSSMYLNLGLTYSLLVVPPLVIGFIVTIHVLARRKRGYAPALPIPVLLATLIYITCVALS